MGKQKYRKIGSWNNKLCMQYALHIEIIYILSLKLYVNFKTLQQYTNDALTSLSVMLKKSNIASIVQMCL
jgi:hypothetical protein